MSIPITNRAFLPNYVFGFGSPSGKILKSSILLSFLATIPLFGSIPAVFGILNRGIVSFLSHEDISNRTYYTLMTMIGLRVVLSSLGLGLLFLLIDILYTLGVWIAERCCPPNTISFQHEVF